MLRLDLGLGQGEQQPHQPRCSNVHMIMENNDKAKHPRSY